MLYLLTNVQKCKVQILCNGLITGLLSHLLSFAKLNNRFTELDKFIQTCGNEPHSTCSHTGKTHKLFLNTSLMGQTVNLNTEHISASWNSREAIGPYREGKGPIHSCLLMLVHIFSFSFKSWNKPSTFNGLDPKSGNAVLFHRCLHKSLGNNMLSVKTDKCYSCLHLSARSSKGSCASFFHKWKNVVGLALFFLCNTIVWIA